MKIAIYSNIIDCGGISKFMYNLNNAFQKSNIESEIVTFDVQTIYGNDINLLNCKNHIDRIKELRNFIINKKITSIISNTWFETLICKLATIGIKNKIKIISVVHIRPNLWGIKENDLAKKMLAKLALNSCDKVVAVSNELKDALINENWVRKKNIITIYNPVIFDNDINAFNERYKYIDIKKKDIVQIAVIGWIQPRKAQDIIIKALNEMQNKRVLINFIGSVADEDKEYYDYIQKLIQNYKLQKYVKFWGAKNNIFDILENMDVLVSASRGEALPTVLIEALYKEVPIISSDCEYGPKEILENGKYGIIFKTDDYKELSNSIEVLINNNEKYNKLKIISKKRSSIFSYKKSIKDYLEILN